MEAFQQNTDEQIWHAVDAIIGMAGHVTATRLEETKRNAGLHAEPGSLLANQNLRPFVKPVSTCFDLLHNYFSGGVVAQETCLLTAALAEAGLSRDQLVQRLRSLSLQSSRTNWASQCSHLKNAYFGDIWKTDGSTQQFLLPLLHFFVWNESKDEKREELQGKLRSFELLCHRVFWVTRLQFRRQAFLLENLRVAEQRHHDKFLTVYGFERLRPKHHYLLHHRSDLARSYSHIKPFHPGLLLSVFKAAVRSVPPTWIGHRHQSLRAKASDCQTCC